ncbi:recombination protein RecR [Alkalispirochaeta sphaeroplastigenens]|uniref:Recombination protein RecR n=1 Tax=Alkalispirochaeta sphaeroplastigenens TaxID=1187066 RepID=A0A2S4K0U2_9SPIO|nr:recombination mediator RecR [Alkalispirochaeta sphaeroplastigenens]POR05378.1 recombination protein RecR [Alkalispirochaeta sphaeroplastigenens]
MNSLERLIQEIARLPGLGKKSATRIAYHLLAGEALEAQRLGNLLQGLHEAIRPCSLCGAFTEEDPCPICSDRGRDHATICVVEQPQDVAVMEASREFQGIYHVLGGVIAPIEGVGPGDLAILSLLQRARNGQVREVIIATNPTVEGDTTALYVARQLREQTGVSVTRLALGLPVGADLEYADRLTLARSLRGRTSLGDDT